MKVLSSNSIHQTEAVVRRCSKKKLFLEISKNSQENTCARVSFSIMLQAEAEAPLVASGQIILKSHIRNAAFHLSEKVFIIIKNETISYIMKIVYVLLLS